MLSIIAINDNESSRSHNLAPTKEAQECHLQKLYQDGLLCIQTNDLPKARSLFQAIIHDPLSIKAQKGATDSLLHLRFLTLRNLGETYVKQGPEFHKEALQCYIQAVSIDEKDVVLWNRLGTLACSLGRLNIARKAFEQGLHCSPRHWSCLEKLAEVLIAIGDETSCFSIAKRLLRLHPKHPRALQIKSVIEQQRDSPGKTLGFDRLEPKHKNLTFQKKRKLEVTPEVTKPKKRIQHSIQLNFPAATWLNVVKSTLEALQNRAQGKVSKSEELKDRGSYLANSRVLFTIQSPEVPPASTSEPVKLLELQSSGEIVIIPGEKEGGGSKLVETEERRSTRSRSRKIDKLEDGGGATAATKSLTQLLESFVAESSPGEVKQAGELDESSGASQRMEGCLVYSATSRDSMEVFEQPESEEVLQFMKEYSENSGLYHVSQGILRKVSARGGDWRDEGALLLELERSTRQWWRSRSAGCNLFLAELWLDAVGSNKLSDHLGNCSYSICRVIESLSLDVNPDEDCSGIEKSRLEKFGWVFWVRFHWLNGRYCMHSGSSSRGFAEFKKCLSLLRAQREAFAGVVLPHCKADNKISLETVEQKLYEFEVGELLQSVGKMEEKHGEVIEALSPVLLSERATRNEVWIAGGYEEALRSNEFKALSLLVSSCRRVKNLPVELRCHLRKLERICRCAGILSLKPEDEVMLNSPGSGSPSSMEVESEKMKATRPWHKGIAEQVKQLAKCAGVLKEKVGEYNIDASVLGRIQRVLLMVLEHFGSGVSSCKRHSNLNLSEHFETGFIVDAAMAFCTVQQLNPSVSLQQQVALLVTMHEILAERGVCGAGASCEDGEGAFLKMAIKHLLTLESKLKQHLLAKASGEGSEFFSGLSEKRSEELEKKKAELGLESALDQFFFCLYGLNLKADSESGLPSSLAIHRTTTCGEFQTKAQCAAVLQYVLPYAKSNSKAGLAKLKQVLQAVRKQFPQPPSHILAGNVIDTFMDDLSFDETRFAEMVMAKASIDELLSFAFPKQEEEPAAAVLIYSTPGAEKTGEEPETSNAGEPYTEVYENLYYLLAQVEDMSPSDKMPGYVLSKEGEDSIEHNASLYKYDLLFNMRRFDSWHKLAATYDEEVDSLLNDGSKSVNALEWRKNSRYTSRVENSRRRSRRCYLMSLALSNTQTHEMHELLALAYYDTLQNTVPSYDQRLFSQKKDAVWITKCLNAYKHFEAAYSQRPDWTHLFYLGKLSEKLGKPGDQYLLLYKRTIDMNPFAVDPVYRLHRSRLKLLCRGRYHDLSIIEVVAKYCFHKQTEELVAGKLNTLNQPDENFVQITSEARQAEIAGVWRVLFKDCISAMQACVDGELKHFHKARFSMAQGFYLRAEEGDWERAKEELAFCFRSSRSLFTVNMWELDGVVNKKNKKKATGSTHAKKLGLPESSRKFITCVRKYLLLYIMLCEKAGDFVTLERAFITIKQDKRFCICLEDIGNVALTSYVNALGAAVQQAEQTGGYVNNTQLYGLLERLFNLFMDHAGAWPESSSSEGGNNSGEDDKSVYCYIHRYLQYLENECRADALELVNERIKRRFKNPKASASSHFLQHAKLAWCRALCSGLASITPLEADQYSQLIVDLQPETLLSSPYDAEFLSKISQVSAARDQSGSPPASAAYISRIRGLRVAQVSQENNEKALGFLRAAFFYYREVTSGPFPGGINLFLATSGDTTEVLEYSIPRKLLLWAYVLIYGRVVNISDVVKHCEEQAKLRLKKWPAASPPAPAVVVAPAAVFLVAPAAPVVQCQAPVQEKVVVACSSKGGEAREPGMEIDLNVVESA